MRTARWTCVLIAAMVWAACARDAQAANRNWGVEGGLVLGSVEAKGQDGFDANAVAGAGIGLFVGTDVERPIVFQVEALFTWRRFESEQSSTAFRVSSRSIDVPLLLRIRIASQARGRAWLDVGPQLAKIGSVEQTVGGTRTDLSDAIKDVDAAAVIGIGGETAAGSGAFVFGARFAIGLRNLSELPQRSLKSRTFTALAGYRF